MYIYKRYTWLDGKYKGCVPLTLTSEYLYAAYGKQGLTQFLLLLNDWNDSSTCNGDNQTKAIHKYVFVGEDK